MTHYKTEEVNKEFVITSEASHGLLYEFTYK